MQNNSASTPLLSIVIPTRNRTQYAMHAIQNVLEIPDNRLELIIQDNSDVCSLKSYINTNIDDSRIYYNYTPTPLSMIDNFNVGLELARGEYICIIGDDDGVNPEILNATIWAKKNNLDSLSTKHNVHYLWPGTDISSTIFTKVTGAELTISPFSGRKIWADSEDELNKLVRNGGVYYLDFNLPRIYHGLVHRRCLEKVKKRTGCYFSGLSPDIFASIAIACVAKRVVIVDYPITIPGSCPIAQKTHHTKKSHLTKLQEAPHLHNRVNYIWCELVPKIYTAETIWVDSAIAALRAMGREDLVETFNIPKLAAYCVGRYDGIFKNVIIDMFAAMKLMNMNFMTGICKFILGLITGPGILFARRASNRFLMLAGVRTIHKYQGIKNTIEASHILSNYLNKNGKKFIS